MAPKNNKDEKHVDKFGYASLMVGDSAALFNDHLNQYGHHYGTAAQNIGTFFTTAEEEGQAFRALAAAQSLLEAGRNFVIPLVATGSIVNAIASCAQTLATLKQAHQTDRIASAEEHQYAVRKAEHLLKISTNEHLKQIVKTARFHATQEKASCAYVILGDSYQSTQLRIFLDGLQESRSDGGDAIPVSIFDTIHDAFDALSKTQRPTTTEKTGRVLIYFHSLEPIEVSQDLHIKDCTNFVFQSDASQAFLRPRLILTGKLHVRRSIGTIRSVGVVGGYDEDKDSCIEFVRCTNVCNACSFWKPTDDKEKSEQNRPRRKTSWPILLVAAPLVVLVSSMFLLRGGNEGGSSVHQGRPDK